MVVFTSFHIHDYNKDSLIPWLFNPAQDQTKNKMFTILEEQTDIFTGSTTKLYVCMIKKT